MCKIYKYSSLEAITQLSNTELDTEKQQYEHKEVWGSITA